MNVLAGDPTWANDSACALSALIGQSNATLDITENFNSATGYWGVEGQFVFPSPAPEPNTLTLLVTALLAIVAALSVRLRILSGKSAAVGPPAQTIAR